MTTERFEIKDRHGLKLVIQVDMPESPSKLVFIQPGQGGFIAQEHITAFAESFLENNYRVVRFDPTNSVGESGGDISEVSYDGYAANLEDVIDWAKSMPWFQQPFALCGHSMGAQTTAWYAEQNPGTVQLLATMAPVVNYELYMPTLDPDYAEKWEEHGYIESVSRSKPGIVKRIGWQVNDSLKKYDILKYANKLTMPVINVVGELDKPCPVANQQVFMETIPSKQKKLVIIQGTEHSYRNNETQQYDEKLNEVKDALSAWLRDINRLTP